MTDPRPFLQGFYNDRISSHVRVAVKSAPELPLEFWPNHVFRESPLSMSARLERIGLLPDISSGQMPSSYHLLNVKDDELIQVRIEHLGETYFV